MTYEWKVNDLKNICIDIIWRFNFNKELSKFKEIQLLNWLDFLLVMIINIENTTVEGIDVNNGSGLFESDW